MNEFSLVYIDSTNGTGSNRNNLTYDLGFVKELKRNYDIEIGFYGIFIRSNDIVALETDRNLRIECSLLRPFNYETLENNNTQVLSSYIKINIDDPDNDFIFYNPNIIYYPAHITNRQNFRIKMTNAIDHSYFSGFGVNTHYTLMLSIKTKMKQRILEKLKYIDIKDIKKITNELLQLELKREEEREQKKKAKKATVLKHTNKTIKKVLDNKVKKVKK